MNILDKTISFRVNSELWNQFLNYSDDRGASNTIRDMIMDFVNHNKIDADEIKEINDLIDKLLICVNEQDYNSIYFEIFERLRELYDSGFGGSDLFNKVNSKFVDAIKNKQNTFNFDE